MFVVDITPLHLLFVIADWAAGFRVLLPASAWYGAVASSKSGWAAHGGRYGRLLRLLSFSSGFTGKRKQTAHHQVGRAFHSQARASPSRPHTASRAASARATSANTVPAQPTRMAAVVPASAPARPTAAPRPRAVATGRRHGPPGSHQPAACSPSHSPCRQRGRGGNGGDGGAGGGRGSQPRPS